MGNRKKSSSVRIVYALTILFLLNPNTPSVEAQNSGLTNALVDVTNTLPAATFGQSPALFQTQVANVNMQDALQKCDGNSNGSVANYILNASAALGGGGGATGGSIKGCPDFSRSVPNACAYKCSTPPVSDVSCDAFTKVKKGKPIGGSADANGTSDDQTVWTDHQGFKDARTKAQNFRDYVNARASCDDPNLIAAQKQLDAFSCKMSALQNGVQQAGQALQAALQANLNVFNQQVQYKGEVDAQVVECEKILGPDPTLGQVSGNTRFIGLLGLQASIKDKVSHLNDPVPGLKGLAGQDLDFQSAADKIVADGITNDQNLEANRMQVVVACMGGPDSSGRTGGTNNLNMKGGYSLQCFKPIPSADGKSYVFDSAGNPKYAKQPCNAKEYIQSMVSQSAFVANGGNVIFSESRKEQAQANSSAVDSLMASMFADMGLGDDVSKDSSGAVNGPKMAPKALTWSDIQTKYAANINAIAQASHVDLNSILSSVAGHCFSDANNWKNQQIKSPGSKYSIQKAVIASNRSLLAGALNTKLGDLNNSYSDVMAALASQHVTLNRFDCTKDDPQKMTACYKQIGQNLTNLLEGNGTNTITSMNITGGAMVSAANLPCQGINGCITALTVFRTRQQKTSQFVKAKITSDTNSSNAQMQAQLHSFAGGLATVYSGMIQQYDALKTQLMKSGVSAPDRPTPLKGVQLQSTEVEDKGPPPGKLTGPYKMPDDMTAVLSAQVPGGLPDFNGSGLKDVRDGIAKKIEDDKKSFEDLAKTATKTADTYSGNCKAKDQSDSEDSDDNKKPKKDKKEEKKDKDSVNNVSYNIDDCKNYRKQCEEDAADRATGGIDDQLSAIIHAMESEHLGGKKYSELQQQLEDEKKWYSADPKNADDKCETMIRNCEQGFESKKVDLTSDTKKTPGAEWAQ